MSLFCIRVFLQLVILVTVISKVTSTNPIAYSAAQPHCPCEKGAKGERGYTMYRTTRAKGQKGDSGSPGVCPNRCSEQVDICSNIIGVFGSQVDLRVSRESSSRSSAGRNRRATDTVMTQLRDGSLGVSDLSKDQAMDVLVSFCISSNSDSSRDGSSSTDSGRTGPGGPRLVAEKGEKGEKGAAGESVQGETGRPGSIGPKGDRGEEGEPGVTGPKGEKGDKGDVGDVGPVGDTGVPGQTGPAGFRGFPGLPGNEGSTYIHWGDHSCPAHSDLLQTGLALTPTEKQNHILCIPDFTKLTQNINYVPSSHTSKVKPLRYTNTRGYTNYLNCALCYVSDKATSFVNIGNDSCPSSWTLEYNGVAVTIFDTEVVCLEGKMAERILWTHRWRNVVNDLKVVEVECPGCRGYPSGYKLTCSVCTK